MSHPLIPCRRSASGLRVLAALLTALPGLASAQTAAATAAPAPTEGCVQVQVHNLRAGQGFLMLAAYGSADSFGKKPLSAKRLAVGEAQMSLQWCGLQGDSVALMGYQDLDSDGKMGRNLVGMPTEPWGGSGTPGSFGPRWDTGRVALGALGGQPIVVRMSQ